MIDLIIKPTQRCNFSCTFCSSPRITEDAENILSLNTLKLYLEQNEVANIIVNGGDPLMMPPEYYWDLIAYLDEKDMPTTISFTTNLWDFYQYPDKWAKLFKHPRVGVVTSFQYGNERRLRNGLAFSEAMFRRICARYKEYMGHNPMFISVITNRNEDYVLDTVKLAKELDTECKINPVVCSGRSGSYYPLYKAYEKYLDIIDAGLAEYEYNAREIVRLYHNMPTTCPYNRECYEGIRAMSPDGILHSCGSFNDTYLDNKLHGRKTYELRGYATDTIQSDFKVLKGECYSCDLFRFCNSCYKNIADIMQANNVEKHCAHMKQIKGRLLWICDQHTELLR